MILLFSVIKRFLLFDLDHVDSRLRSSQAVHRQVLWLLSTLRLMLAWEFLVVLDWRLGQVCHRVMFIRFDLVYRVNWSQLWSHESFGSDWVLLSLSSRRSLWKQFVDQLIHLGHQFWKWHLHEHLSIRHRRSIPNQSAWRPVLINYGVHLRLAFHRAFSALISLLVWRVVELMADRTCRHAVGVVTSSLFHLAGLDVWRLVFFNVRLSCCMRIDIDRIDLTHLVRKQVWSSLGLNLQKGSLQFENLLNNINL